MGGGLRARAESWQTAVFVGGIARVSNGQTAGVSGHGRYCTCLSRQTAGSVDCIVPVGVCLIEGTRVAPRPLEFFFFLVRTYVFS